MRKGSSFIQPEITKKEIFQNWSHRQGLSVCFVRLKEKTNKKRKKISSRTNPTYLPCSGWLPNNTINNNNRTCGWPCSALQHWDSYHCCFSDLCSCSSGDCWCVCLRHSPVSPWHHDACVSFKAMIYFWSSVHRTTWSNMSPNICRVACNDTSSCADGWKGDCG